jgi:hypothetical protein
VVQGPVGAVDVEMGLIFGENLAQVVGVHDEDPVQEFTAYAADPAFHDRVSLKRLYVLVFIEHGTRWMYLGGVTGHPTAKWTVQQARNLAMSLGARFEDIKFLPRGHGPNFTPSSGAVFQAAGARTLPTAVQAPPMNAGLRTPRRHPAP